MLISIGFASPDNGRTPGPRSGEVLVRRGAAKPSGGPSPHAPLLMRLAARVGRSPLSGMQPALDERPRCGRGRLADQPFAPAQRRATLEAEGEAYAARVLEAPAADEAGVEELGQVAKRLTKKKGTGDAA